MRTWRGVPGEGKLLVSQVGLQLIDDLTGKAPLGGVRVSLDREVAAGVWAEQGVRPAITARWIVTYPYLGRQVAVAGQPARRYRVRLNTEFYRPLYRRDGAGGISFDVFPYNDANPPALLPLSPADTFLLPAPHYPFPAHLRVLRGLVLDAAGAPVPDAIVSEDNRERVLTDDAGAFSLPLRWAPNATPVAIDAEHVPSGRTGSINVTLPDDLATSRSITIS